MDRLQLTADQKDAFAAKIKQIQENAKYVNSVSVNHATNCIEIKLSAWAVGYSNTEIPVRPAKADDADHLARAMLQKAKAGGTIGAADIDELWGTLDVR